MTRDEFTEAIEDLPLHTNKMLLACRLMDELFNKAEIRHNITEWCKIEVKFD